LKPKLAIARASGKMALTWPSYAKDYRLEENFDLSTPSWNLVNPIPEDDGTKQTITISPTTNVAAFRLRR
jgi:hypothetical protein